MEGCYIFKTDKEIFIYPLKNIPLSKIKFKIKETRESIFYYFFGLDFLNEEPELEKQLSLYLKSDTKYEPNDIHPALQGSNYEKIKKFPILFKRINKLKVLYDKRKLEEILKDNVFSKF